MRSSLHPSSSTALVRQLTRWLPTGAVVSGAEVADRLGQWLHVAEAIALHSAQGAWTRVDRRSAPEPLRMPQVDLQTQLLRELDRVRGVLSRSIKARDPSHKPDPRDPDTEFALFQQRLHDQQRRMEMSVDALRQHVRQQLSRGTPELAQLAALDAQMESLFAGREQRLLSQLPVFLKARFVTLRQEAVAADAADDPRWLHTFGTEFEQALLAELDLRLLPVTGLIESLEQ